MLEAFIFLAFVIICLLLWQLLKRQQKNVGEDQSLLLLQNNINELTRALDKRLGESTQVVQQQFGESHKVIASVSSQLQNVTEHLTRLGETNKQVMHFTDQLQALQDILKNPKQRGILGEYYLETVLKNVLPPGSYQIQYPFRDGDIVDAVIFYQDKIIPIDSKFSLENYNRILEARTEEDRKRFEEALRADLKNRIDETAKYIKPAEGTIEFAFMFIPSEALYYDLLINKVGSVTARDLIQYATAEKKVFVVSPTSFLAYLQTVIWGLNQTKIHESAELIRKNVSELSRHLQAYDIYFQKLGTHLNTTYSMYTKAHGEFKKINKDVYRITGESMDLQQPLIEPPLLESQE